ncbi:MAG: DUF721 domain-containing protein [Hyphomicrobiales bacterium]|nr:DUF721 domain-containing protein [Hyphomicrobiales bacterium]
MGRPLADLVAPALGKTLAARGFAAADVVLAWPEIVGERLARVCEPIALEWPRGPRIGEDDRQSATLVLRVEGAFGLEVQHLAPAILERINSHFGWRCAGKLAIRQGRVTGKAGPKPAPPSTDAQARVKSRKMAADIADEGLRRAITELGAVVLAKH